MRSAVRYRPAAYSPPDGKGAPVLISLVADFIAHACAVGDDDPFVALFVLDDKDAWSRRWWAQHRPYRPARRRHWSWCHCCAGSSDDGRRLAAFDRRRCALTAFWLLPACGTAPLPMRPGLMSAVAFNTAVTTSCRRLDVAAPSRLAKTRLPRRLISPLRAGPAHRRTWQPASRRRRRR